jgi:secreted PhoX family phosphatase
VPLKAMGPLQSRSGRGRSAHRIVYLTEDRDNGLFYRFLPGPEGAARPWRALQALAFADADHGADSRNWSGRDMPLQAWRRVRWIDIDGPRAPTTTCACAATARRVLFARGEGIHYGDNELYFCCTSGGAARLSQIMRYRPVAREGQPASGRSRASCNCSWNRPMPRRSITATISSLRRTGT